MTQTVELPLPEERVSERKLVASVCFAHFVSHYYIMILAPLFVFVREEYGVSYTELGLALTAWNVLSTVLQTPAGFLVDRVSARLVIIAGLFLGAGAFAIAGLVHSFWVFVAMFAVAGIGNTVYHPADYALLSQHVAPERAGRVFSFHTFSGMIGNAAAPATLLYLQSIVGWRGAFLFAAALGVAAASILIWMGEPDQGNPASKGRAAAAGHAPVDGFKLLTSPPILMSLVFFILLAFCGGGLNNYMVVSLGALHGTPFAVANAALTGMLMMSAAGVLVGGMLTGYTARHGIVAAAGLMATASVCVMVGLVDFNALALVLLMSCAGFFSGITMPSRDMIVRSVTPPGAYGRVFGFVSTGFNIAGIVSPLIFGQLLDRGYPREIFFFMATCALLAIGTVVINTTRKRGA
ncbi:MAG: transporter, family, fosmidomycin resistance protein [Alphaproteobacteria bacterium]|jgi:MFS family permease|nr:transporter, family, fosmidomycin resistance protein [Alphaproteobacteria bacterium]